MAFDFKKAYKALYMPQNVPELITVPPANYIAVRGHGDPNEEGGAYKQAIEILYSVAYTLKMSYKTEHQIEGFFEYVVPPLEGFWWQEGTDSADYTNKSAFNWISVLRLPAFVTEADVHWAVETASKKKKLDCSPVEFMTIDEGLCVQMMHLTMNRQALRKWTHFYLKTVLSTISAPSDFIMKFIYPTQEGLPLKSAKP